jgi:hypothetical protein
MSNKGKKLKRHATAWSENEVRNLRAYAKQGLPAREAAKRLGRAHGATRYKAMVLGITFRSIRQPKGAQKKAQATIRAKARKLSAAAKKGAATRKAKLGPMVSNHAL